MQVGGTMLINKARIIASLTAAIEAREDIDFYVNCARWDAMLDLSRGSTKLHITAAAHAAGYDAIRHLQVFELKYRAAF